MMLKPALSTPIAISLGAIGGALSRYYLGVWFVQLLNSSFPYSTLLINLSGCLLMGVITTLALRRLTFSTEVRLVLTTGFLGSYTTFSTYELDTQKLLEQNPTSGLLYGLGSILLGLLNFYLGAALVNKIGIQTEPDQRS